MFSFQNIADDNHSPDVRLRGDYEVAFDSDIHKEMKYLLVLPLLFFLGLIFPFFILVQLIQKKRRNVLTDKINLINYGFSFFLLKKIATFGKSFFLSQFKLLLLLQTIWQILMKN